MPDPLMGRYASFKIGTVLVENLGRWTLRLTGADIDVTAFGDGWERRMPGMKGWNASLEGSYDPADTDGQAILEAAYLAGTKITNARFYLDSTSYWAPDTSDPITGCYINTIDITHDKAGVATATFNLLGYGKLKCV